MSLVKDSRKQVLEAIGAATAGSATRNTSATAEKAAEIRPDVPREYVRKGNMTASAVHERFIERLREYDAEVLECAPEGLAEAIAAQLAASGRRRIVAPEGLPAEWLAKGFEWKIDRGLTASEVEQCEGVVTASFCGVAESGTIVLHHSAAEGRRVITLLPDWHLCVVYASRVVETLPEYFSRCTSSGQWSVVSGQGTGNDNAGTMGRGARDVGIEDEKLPALVTWISGPSATADIEMTRIKGVHGPRFLHVILVKDVETGNEGTGEKGPG